MGTEIWMHALLKEILSVAAGTAARFTSNYYLIVMGHLLRVCRRTSWTLWSRLPESPWSLSGQVCLLRWACLMGACVCPTGFVVLSQLCFNAISSISIGGECDWIFFKWLVCCRLCPASTSAAWSATLELEAAPRPEQQLLPERLLLVTLQVSLGTGYYGSHSPNGTPLCMLVDEWEPW